MTKTLNFKRFTTLVHLFARRYKWRINITLNRDKEKIAELLFSEANQ